MIVIEKTKGRKIPYDISKNNIFFNDEIMLNLERYERDYERNIDICEDENFGLVNGLGRRYVAQIVIPAREYIMSENLSRETDEGAEEESEFIKEAVPFDVSRCTLILWGLDQYE